MLALVQVIPVVGQLMLIGYGLEIVRSIYAGRVDLPTIHGGRRCTMEDLFWGRVCHCPIAVRGFNLSYRCFHVANDIQLSSLSTFANKRAYLLPCLHAQDYSLQYEKCLSSIEFLLSPI